MQVWRLLIAADWRDDLLDPMKGRAWLWKQRWCWGWPHVPDVPKPPARKVAKWKWRRAKTKPVQEQQGATPFDIEWLPSQLPPIPPGTKHIPHYDGWDDEQSDVWKRSLAAMRSVVSRLYPYFEDVHATTKSIAIAADMVFAEYVSYLRPSLVTAPDTHGPFTHENFRGVRFFPRLDEGKRLSATAAGQQTFWCRAFASLVMKDSVPYCSACGEKLPKTPGGKENTQQTCERCRYRLWYARTNATLSDKERDDRSDRRNAKRTKSKPQPQRRKKR